MRGSVHRKRPWKLMENQERDGNFKEKQVSGNWKSQGEKAGEMIWY